VHHGSPAPTRHPSAAVGPCTRCPPASSTRSARPAGVDHLASQPILGLVLNVFNRFVIPRIDALAGYELFANLVVAVVGAVVMVAASRVRKA
jgi:hypothetical protein